MKKLSFLTTLLCILVLTGSAQIVHHHSYTTYYDAKIKEPDSVSWNLTPAMVSCHVTRVNLFAQDPDISNSANPDDYKVNAHAPDRKAWINQGHLFNYEDAQFDATDRMECFYMSNMLPQNASFNEGDWKTLEIQERVWAKTATLHIIAGGLGSIGTLPAGENIPKYMWKAIYMNGTWTGWIMLNAITSIKHKYTFWQCASMADFDRQTGLSL